MSKTLALVVTIISVLIISAMTIIHCDTFVSAQTNSVTINVDGSITPSTATIQRNGNVYTLIGNVEGNVNNYRSNIILDGRGNSINEFLAESVSNITVKNINVIMKNQFTENVGMTFNNASDSLITNNTIAGFWSIYAMNGVDFGGIYIIGGNSNILSKNIIRDNLVGMSLINTSQNFIVQNNFTSNTEYTTLIHFVSASNNTVHHNNFVSSASTTRVYYSTDSWDNGSASGGNYWSDYNGNGVYVIDQDNIDNYPLNKPFDIYQQSILTLLTPTPAVSEFSLLAIPFLLTIIVTTGLLVYHKKHK
jgi:parallel beta-helix repeat protein